MIVDVIQLTAGTPIDREPCTLLRDRASYKKCWPTLIDGNTKVNRRVSNANSQSSFCWLPTVNWDCIEERTGANEYISKL